MPSSDILLDPQILVVLLKHLSPGTIPYGDPDADSIALRHEKQKALARLARVCRAISEPSLDLLWRSIDDFRYLLRPFKSYDNRYSMFTDVVTEDEWTRFCEYGRRVRELRLSDVSKVHVSIWTVLTRWSLREPLLPSLERLVDFRVSSMSVCYAILFSSTIRHFGLVLEESANKTIVRMGIRIAQPLFSQLQSLSLHDRHDTYDKKAEAVRFWEMSHLRELRVQHEVALTRRMLEALAAFPHLSALYINIKQVDSMAGTKASPAFPSLRKLELVGLFGDIDAFLEAAPPPRVEEVSLHGHVKSDGGSKDITALLQKILPRLPPSTLRVISVECTTYERIQVDAAVTLGQLATFLDLTSITLAFRNNLQFPLADDCLSTHSKTWPQLRVFEVYAVPKVTSRRDDYGERGRSYGGYRSYTPIIHEIDYREHEKNKKEHEKNKKEPAPTIATIAAFVAAHSHLERFALPTLDLTAVPDIASVPHLNHGLRTLKFVSLADGVPLLPFVLTFDLLFPRLDLAAAEGDLKPGSSPDRAQQLLAMLLTVQAGRVGAYRTLQPDESTSDAAAAGHDEIIRLIGQEQPEEKGRVIGDGHGGHSHSGSYSRSRSRSADSEVPPRPDEPEVIERPSSPGSEW